MADAQKSSTGTLIFAFAVAAIGGVVAGWIGHDMMAPAPAQPPLSSMLSEPAAPVAPPNSAAIAAAQSEQVKTLEAIVGGCVADLRDYTGRLKSIADVAEAEGSTTAAEQMREFGAEIDDKLGGFDRISNQ